MIRYYVERHIPRPKYANGTKVYNGVIVEHMCARMELGGKMLERSLEYWFTPLTQEEIANGRSPIALFKKIREADEVIQAFRDQGWEGDYYVITRKI